MRRAACFLPGLVLVGSMYWSMAFGLGGLTLSWVLGVDDALEDEIALEIESAAGSRERARPVIPDPRLEAKSCWMLAVEDPAPGEVQRWRMSRCAQQLGDRSGMKMPAFEQRPGDEWPYGRTSF